MKQKQQTNNNNIIINKYRKQIIFIDFMGSVNGFFVYTPIIININQINNHQYIYIGF